MAFRIIQTPYGETEADSSRSFIIQVKNLGIRHKTKLSLDSLDEKWGAVASERDKTCGLSSEKAAGSSI
ncbi:hypothetical protein [Helicobacter canis]|uniref:hypothetical protein n=1 Tax=Helicobacter canis TaxID=29419 RepID=UPI000E0F356F|nr:hypothetical protein [Helicobacter canis]